MLLSAFSARLLAANYDLHRYTTNGVRLLLHLYLRHHSQLAFSNFAHDTVHTDAFLTQLNIGSKRFSNPEP